MSNQHRSLSERLLRYSAVASLTASAGLLASPESLTAEISAYPCVIDGFTTFTCPIDFDDPTGATPEFNVSFDRTATTLGATSELYLHALTNGGDSGRSVIGSASNTLIYPFVLPFNYAISAGRSWQALSGTGSATLYWHSSSTTGTPRTYGNWNPTQGTAGDGSSSAYLGVKFNLDGSGPYYGWIEIFYERTTVTVKRIGYNATGDPTPAAVQLSDASAVTGLRSVVAAGLTGLSGALLWLRRKFTRA